jgi:hypothetical protein
VGVLLLFLAAATATGTDNIQAQFEDFKLTYSRHYASAAAEAHALDCFTQNLKHIEELNSARSDGALLVINVLADLCPGEFKGGLLKGRHIRTPIHSAVGEPAPVVPPSVVPTTVPPATLTIIPSPLGDGVLLPTVPPAAPTTPAATAGPAFGANVKEEDTAPTTQDIRPTTPSPRQPSRTSLGIAIGTVAGGAILISVVVATIILFQRRSTVYIIEIKRGTPPDSTTLPLPLAAYKPTEALPAPSADELV